MSAGLLFAVGLISLTLVMLAAALLFGGPSPAPAMASEPGSGTERVVNDVVESLWNWKSQVFTPGAKSPQPAPFTRPNPCSVGPKL